MLRIVLPTSELTARGGGQPENRPTNGRLALEDQAIRQLLTCPWCMRTGRNGKDFRADPVPCGTCGRPIESKRKQCRRCGKVFFMPNNSYPDDKPNMSDREREHVVPQHLLNRRYRCPWCSAEGFIGKAFVTSEAYCRACGQSRLDVPNGSTVLQCHCGQLSVVTAVALLRYSKGGY
jgi:hypothetical protein